MKKIIFFATLMFAFLLQAQNDLENLELQWNNYNSLLVNSQVEEAMEMVHPGIFNIIPKESMISMFKGLLNSEEVSVKFLGHAITSFEEPVEHDENTYYKFEYSQILGMKYLESEETEVATQPLLMMSLQKRYGDENVSYDEETQFYRIKADKKGIAMYNNDSKDWKFLTLENGQKPLLEKFLPEEVIKYIYK